MTSSCSPSCLFMGVLDDLESKTNKYYGNMHSDEFFMELSIFFRVSELTQNYNKRTTHEKGKPYYMERKNHTIETNLTKREPKQFPMMRYSKSTVRIFQLLTRSVWILLAMVWRMMLQMIMMICHPSNLRHIIITWLPTTGIVAMKKQNW